MTERIRMDFSMQRGHELLLSGEPPFQREDMDEIDLSMLQQHTAFGLLSADWVEMDGTLTFRYAIDGRKLLSHRLRLQPLGMNDFYALLLGAVDILDGCKPNLLREEAVLLNEEYLFVGEEWSDLRAAYVPLKRTGEDKHPREALQLLAVKWVARVTHVDGAGLRHVLQLLEQGGTWQELRVQLLGLIGGGFPSREKGRNTSAAPLFAAAKHREPAPLAGLEVNPQAVERPEPDDGGVRWSFGGFGSKRMAEDAPASSPLDTDDSGWLDDPMPGFDEPDNSERLAKRKWIAAAAAAVMTAIIWRTLYAPDPRESNLLLAGGLTALIGCVLLLLWRRLGAGSDDNEEPEEPLEPFAPAASGRADAWRADRQDDVAADTERQRSQGASPAARDDTVLLSPERSEFEPRQINAVLIREWRGSAETKELSEGAAVVGRSVGAADLADRAEGVSRAHLEFVRKGADLEVRDLGSRNGSLLNGQPMVPYKYYAFGEGDQVQLAGASGPVYRRKK